jgi:hypothetical protein
VGPILNHVRDANILICIRNAKNFFSMPNHPIRIQGNAQGRNALHRLPRARATSRPLRPDPGFHGGADEYAAGQFGTVGKKLSKKKAVVPATVGCTYRRRCDPPATPCPCSSPSSSVVSSLTSAPICTPPPDWEPPTTLKKSISSGFRDQLKEPPAPDVRPQKR